MLVPTLSTLLLHSNNLTINQVKQIHAKAITNAVKNIDSHVLRQILNSSSNYTNTTADYVDTILHNLPKPDAYSWSHTVRFWCRHRHCDKALSLYAEMQRLGVCPITFAITSALKACAKVLNKFLGVSIHGQVHKYGFSRDVFVCVGVVDLYAKLGDMSSAEKLFDEVDERSVALWNSLLSGYLRAGDLVIAEQVFEGIPGRDVISWNVMVSGYARAGRMEQACSLFEKMPEKNLASWNALISGYVECKDVELAQGVFDAMPQRNSVSWLTMISGYSKCGDAKRARELFDAMSRKDHLVFNAMITCYARNGQAMEALKLFNEMIESNVDVQPDKMTLASVISACSQIGDLKFGLWIESHMEKLGILLDDHLVTALVDMYAKCGNIDKAYELFSSMRKKDLIAYSAMIMGCGINGKVHDAIKLFKQMIDAQIFPNLLTFSGLLTAYNHAGLVDEGYQCFESMKKYGLNPSVDHYGIMVDLLGRAGRLEKAYQLIKNMPIQPHAGVWGALLLACRVHNNVELGEIAAQHCFKLEPDISGYSSLLSNIYASAERWDDVGRLRKIMGERRLAKMPGYSWMELN